MNMKLKRSIAMLLLVCSLVSLLGVGAFATGGESAPETTPQGEGQTSSTLTLSPTFVPPTDSAAGETPDTSAPDDGGDLTPTGYTITFYDNAGKVLVTLESHADGALTEDEYAKFSAANPAAGYGYWYGTCDGKPAITCSTEELKTVALSGNYSLYAACLVTYYDPSGTLGTEIVKYGEKPTNVPQKTTAGTTITGWTLSGTTSDKETSADPAQTVITGDIGFVCKPYDAPDKDYTVTFYDYDGTKLGTVTTKGGIIDPSLVPTSPYLKGAAVSGWLDIDSSRDLTMEIFDLSKYNIIRDLELYAAWRISYVTTDGDEITKELVLMNNSPANPPEIVYKTETPIAGWLNESGESVEPDKQEIIGNCVYTAWTRPTLVMDKSVAYVKGNADKNGNVYRFLPDGKLTRAEAAKMLYGLLSDSVTGKDGPLSVTFTDVAAPGTKGAPWYAESIYTMASYGLLNGTGNGLFEPTREITRAEFINMVARIYGIKTSTTSCPFTDVPGKRWYYDAVMTAYDNEWITGYAQENGTYTFEPQRMITRAEAVSILNRVVGRTPTAEDKARIDKYDWQLFIDVGSNWAYYEIMQAATGCGESIPKTGLTKGRHTFKLNGVDTYFFVNDDELFVAVKAGLNKMTDGKSYYFRTNGVAAPVYSAGLRILGGKMYLLSSDGSVVTEPRSGYDTRVYEYKGHMYYIQDDGSLLRNGYFGQLYFGQNGAYTSGDSVLDTWVNNFINSHSAISSASTQEDKLYEAYVALRDYPKERHGNGALGYFRYDLRSYTEPEHASLFFERARGSCEEWGYAMVYLARRIGYKAADAVGKLGGQNNAIHVWEVIEIRGTLYTFDVEQEWGFMYRHYRTDVSYRDCWKMEYAPSEKIKYGSRFGGVWAGKNNIWSPYVYNRSTSGLGF